MSLLSDVQELRTELNDVLNTIMEKMNSSVNHSFVCGEMAVTFDIIERLDDILKTHCEEILTDDNIGQG